MRLQTGERATSLEKLRCIRDQQETELMLKQFKSHFVDLNTSFEEGDERASNDGAKCWTNVPIEIAFVQQAADNFLRTFQTRSLFPNLWKDELYKREKKSLFTALTLIC